MDILRTGWMDLRFSLKFATANHFADDTYIIYQSKKLKALESDLNQDSLNVDKTKLLLFIQIKRKWIMASVLK